MTDEVDGVAQLAGVAAIDPFGGQLDRRASGGRQPKADESTAAFFDTAGLHGFVEQYFWTRLVLARGKLHHIRVDCLEADARAGRDDVVSGRANFAEDRKKSSWNSGNIDQAFKKSSREPSQRARCASTVAISSRNSICAMLRALVTSH